MSDLLIMFLLGAVIFGSLCYCLGLDEGKRRASDALRQAARGGRP